MNKIQRWSKLDGKIQTKQYDLGGILQGVGGIASAVPGPIGLVGSGISMIGGLFNNAKKKKEEQALLNQQKLQDTQAMINALPKSGQGLAQGIMAYGGYLTPEVLAKSGIHIAPSKRGTFKAQASKMGMSVQAAASKILAAKEGTYSPAMRKKANFAKNFAKAEGGYMAADGLILPDGGDGKTTTSGFTTVTTDDDAFINFLKNQKGDVNDPSYQRRMRDAFNKLNKQNAVGVYEGKGKSLGIETKSTPAMNWYPSSAALSQYKMGNKDVIFGHYSSDKYGSASQGVPIRYNDLINLKNNPKYRDILPKDYEALLQGVGYNNQTVQKAKGGFVNPLSLPNNSLYSYTGGGTHNQNPLGGIPLGKSVQGKQNTVENKETSFVFPEGKYIFSNRLKLRK